MKLITGFLIFFMCFSLQAQKTEVKRELRQTIETFFEGFHSRDSLIIKSVTSEEVVMQSIGIDGKGEAVLQQGDFSEFLKSIVSIPAETTFKEELHSFDIKVDSIMANVWIPYSLFIDGALSHCGANNFQLYRKDGKWEIIYLIDTRRKTGCEDR